MLLPMTNKVLRDTSGRQAILFIFVLVLGAAWIGITAAFFPKTTGGGIPAPKEDFLAPDFSLQTASGDSYQLSEQRGQVILVNFWATWCPPCRYEMPVMQRVYQDYKDRGFTILAVNVTNQDSPAKVAAFTSDLELTFPILMDLDGTVTRQYQIHSFPTSFFIDKTGNVHEVVIGGPMAESLLRTRIEKLIGGND